MPTAKKIIKKVRRQYKPKKLEPKWKQLKAQHDARVYREQLWERDKKVVRDHNFNKMLAGLEQYREKVQTEKERQEQINQTRLKNLKKARRVRRKHE